MKNQSEDFLQFKILSFSQEKGEIDEKKGKGKMRILKENDIIS